MPTTNVSTTIGGSYIDTTTAVINDSKVATVSLSCDDWGSVTSSISRDTTTTKYDKEEISTNKTIQNWNNIYLNTKNILVHDMHEIKNIKIIKENKVVEIEFYSQKKIKTVCSDPDVFSLERACYIALAKYIYGEEFTTKGIEHLADFLAVQKRYVKIVREGLSKYKEECRKEQIRLKEQEERERVRKHKQEKKAAYKARKAERNKQNQIDIIAEAIRKAQN